MASELILFNGKLSGTFTPSKGVLISARRVTLRWAVTVVGDPANVEWYFEYSGDKSTWFAETTEESQGDGDVNMPAVVRTLLANGGGSLPVGQTLLSTQFTRDEQLVRVQLKSAGNVSVKLTTPFPNGGRPF